MTDNSFPLVPSPELVQQWDTEGYHQDYCSPFEYAIAQAARWGADQELEACVEWLGDAPVVYNDNGDLHPGSYLRDARRPKPPSLKEQALMALEDGDIGPGASLTPVEVCIIRRALEQLDD